MKVIAGFLMSYLIFMVPLIFAECFRQQTSSSVNTTDWHWYCDEHNGFSFRYPKNLMLIQNDIKSSNMKELVVSLDIKDPGNPRVVLRILVTVPRIGPEDDPKIPLRSVSFYKKVCKKYREFILDNRTAITCVTCGSAACHWRVIVFSPKNQFRMLTFLADEHEKDGPEDGTYPILTIINSFCFD